MLHWVLNPGIAFNDLALGQRLPAVMHECRHCRTYFVDCPHCRTSCDSLALKAFGAWSGLPCPSCGASLPVLRNGLAWLVTLPLAPFRRRRAARPNPTSRAGGRAPTT